MKLRFPLPRWPGVQVIALLALTVLGADRLAAGSPATPDVTVPARMQRFVDEGAISGAVTLVARHDRVLALAAVGVSDLATQRPMRKDDLFWIASMTKPMTAVAVMMLADEGRLSVDDPVEKHLPEFHNPWLKVTGSETGMTLKRPARPITVHDLVTHTSGIGDVPAPRPDASLAELVMACAQQPLRFEPGTRWEYANAGINTLGRIVEVVSGEPFAAFLQHRLLTPLHMRDTTFWPTPAQVRRLAQAYKPRNGGGLERTDIYFIQGSLSSRRRTAFPAGGLFSTASDVAQFYQMMLNRGVGHGHRLLSEQGVAEMTRTQTGDIKTGFVEGMSWGLGFQVVKAPQGVTAMLSSGTFGHGGAYGTQSWADPAKDLVLVMMIQRAGLPNGDASDMRRAFQETAVEAWGR
ncbi:MAG: serine hydrolase domain-containing protein [Verrucomicrobiota bacterium]|jgi:CubicO group peptidase (beta-lactamase class C family)